MVIRLGVLLLVLRSTPRWGSCTLLAGQLSIGISRDMHIVRRVISIISWGTSRSKLGCSAPRRLSTYTLCRATKNTKSTKNAKNSIFVFVHGVVSGGCPGGLSGDVLALYWGRQPPTWVSGTQLRHHPGSDRRVVSGGLPAAFQERVSPPCFCKPHPPGNLHGHPARRETRKDANDANPLPLVSRKNRCK